MSFVVTTAERLVDDPAAEDRILADTRTQLRMLLVGAAQLALAALSLWHHRVHGTRHGPRLPPPPGQRVPARVQAFGSSRAGAWVFSRTLRHLDTAVARVSRGRQSAPQLLAGLPVLDLTTTGRRSGQPRTSHLISIPVGDDLALLGTNFGQPATPAWVLNLEADPHASVTYRGRTLPAWSPAPRPTPSEPR